MNKEEGQSKEEGHRKIRVKYVDLALQFATLEKEIIPALTALCRTGDFILGSAVEELEKKFARYCQTPYALGVGNGTDALVLCLKALDIGPGDEIITTPNSFIATAGAIVAVGATPVFVDVQDDFNMDPSLLEKKIGKRTRAIIVVHLTGRPAQMNPIGEIAQRKNVLIIEDAAQAIGAEYYRRRVGSFGIAGCFSLHPLKNLNAGGDGGMITTSNDQLYQKLLKLRNHGLRNRDEADFWGYNSRLDAMQAAIVNIKFTYLEQWNARIREIAATYQRKLASVVQVPRDEEEEKAVYHTFIIQSKKRDQLQAYLLARGIETKIHYKIPIHLQQAATALGYKKGDFPKVEEQAERILSLPIYPELTDEQVEEVIKGIISFHQSKSTESL